MHLNNKENLLKLLIILPMIIFFLFGFFQISKFETTDEHFWVKSNGEGRIKNYWRSIEKGNWKKTRVNDKPGVSLALISGWPMTFMEGVTNSETYSQNTPFRVALLFFIGAFYFYFYWALKKIINKQKALLAVSLLYLSPIILGISRILNPDALLWLFSFAAIISWLVFLKKPTKHDLVLTSVFLALALLSKYSAIIIIPFLFFLTILFILKDFSSDKESARENITKLGYFWIGIILMIFFFSFFMPSVFEMPIHLYKNLIHFKEIIYVYGLMIIISLTFFLDFKFLKNKISHWMGFIVNKIQDPIFKIGLGFSFLSFSLAALNWSIGKNFLRIADIPFDAGQESLEFGAIPIWQRFFLELKPLIFSLNPLVLVLLLLSLLYFFLRKKEAELYASISLLFIGIFYLSVIQQNLLVHPRYSVVLYPFVFIIISSGLIDFLLKFKVKKKILLIIFALLVISQALSLWIIKPFYLNYANSFLPKTETISNTWGYGGYEAAQYLNSLSNASEISVWSDEPIVCRFFVGDCVRGNNFEAASITNEDHYDYFIKTRRGSIKAGPAWRKFLRLELFSEKKVAWELLIGERKENFIRIYEGN